MAYRMWQRFWDYVTFKVPGNSREDPLMNYSKRNSSGCSPEEDQIDDADRSRTRSKRARRNNHQFSAEEETEFWKSYPYDTCDCAAGDKHVAKAKAEFRKRSAHERDHRVCNEGKTGSDESANPKAGTVAPELSSEFAPAKRKA